MFSLAAVLSVLVWGQLVATGDAKDSFCPGVNDNCMNAHNWAECKAIEESGCKLLEVMESCPLQFACGDESRIVSSKSGKKSVYPPPPPVCDTVVKTTCLGDCPPRGRDLRLSTEETSLTYLVPGGEGAGSGKKGSSSGKKSKSSSGKKKGYDDDHHYFCLSAEIRGYCGYVSASAEITVDGQVVESNADLSQVTTFMAYPGDLIDVDVDIMIDESITCATAGSFYLDLATKS